MAAQENHESVVRYLLAHNANQALATEVCSFHSFLYFSFFLHRKTKYSIIFIQSVLNVDKVPSFETEGKLLHDAERRKKPLVFLQLRGLDRWWLSYK